MPTPEFITQLRASIGHDLLWLSGVDGFVLREDEGKEHVLLIYRTDLECWANIGGIIEPGEGPAECLLREIREEAGVEAEIGQLVGISSGATMTYPNGDICRFLDHTFSCRWISGEPRPDLDETAQARWFPIDEIPPLEPAIQAHWELLRSGTPLPVIA